MNKSAVKNIFLHQLELNKLKFLFILPGYIIIILLFILPSVTGSSEIDSNKFNYVINFYSHKYPLLKMEFIIQLMMVDIKLLNFLLVMTFIIPMFLTVDLIVKEKEEKTIENLFALPISDLDILIGKTSVSIIITILSVWILYLGTICVALYYKMNYLLTHIISFKWIITFILLIPLISFSLNLVAITISCLVNKYQTSQFVSVIILAPFVLFFTLVSNGTLILSTSYLFIIAIILIVVGILFLKLSLRLFQKEKILTRF